MELAARQAYYTTATTSIKCISQDVIAGINKMLRGLFFSRVGIIGQITDVQKQATVVILFISKEVLSEGANKSGKVPEEIQTAKTSPEKKQHRNGP